jgi:hypothetical protein
MAVNDTFADIAALLKDLAEAEIAEPPSGRRHPSPRPRFFSPSRCGPARLDGMLPGAHDGDGTAPVAGGDGEMELPAA